MEDVGADTSGAEDLRHEQSDLWILWNYRSSSGNNLSAYRTVGNVKGVMSATHGGTSLNPSTQEAQADLVSSGSPLTTQ